MHVNYNEVNKQRPRRQSVPYWRWSRWPPRCRVARSPRRGRGRTKTKKPTCYGLEDALCRVNNGLIMAAAMHFSASSQSLYENNGRRRYAELSISRRCAWLLACAWSSGHFLVDAVEPANWVTCPTLAWTAAGARSFIRTNAFVLEMIFSIFFLSRRRGMVWMRRSCQFNQKRYTLFWSSTSRQKLD